MFERIVEIILFLVKELKSNKQLGEIDVSSLSKSGYTQSEISSAFSWLFERMAEQRPNSISASVGASSHRVLHEAERMVISPEAFGYMMQFHQLGVLTLADIEEIIERIMSAGFSQADLPEMKSLIAGMLFQSEDPSMLNHRLHLNHDDTIN
jgi:uncharacterized protein Smg (DUF494 family)